ncbi:Alpha/Beta hydrolase protein [Xylaria flabelliformis]|nr:Alpha/Beta hydrolase protein [Xylaria flabelliformis]
MHKNALSLALCVAAGTLAQGQTINKLQSAGFNSTFTLSAAQIKAANLSTSAVANLEAAVRFDQSQLANGGSYEDAFYTLPALVGNGTIEPGKLLKVQQVTDPKSFTLPANTALSRILYTTTNLNGTVIPNSAFVLWPFQPRVFNSTAEGKATSAPVVLWSHGTAGFFGPAAPSTNRGLWYANAAPFTLALDGYAVVASDFAGLGIDKSWDGSDIPHQYLASRVSARDGLYALRAAKEAFAGLLSDEFVSFGHSQGGGVAWGVAEVLAEKESESDFADLKTGYRGSIAGSPTTDLFTGTPYLILPFVSLGLKSIFPSFDLTEWLTSLGIARLNLFREIRGGIAEAQSLFLDPTSGPVIKEDSWNQTWYVDAYGRLGNVGSRPFLGPLLVIQGTADVYIPYPVTTKTVQDTCQFLESEKISGDLEYLVVNGTMHVPTLDATRPIWLEWIADRFEGRPVERSGCVTTHLNSWLPLENYILTSDSYLQFAGEPEYSYETPLGI